MTAFWRLARQQPLIFLAVMVLVSSGVAGATAVICFIQAVNVRPPGGTAPAANVVLITPPPVVGAAWVAASSDPFNRMECWASRAVIATAKLGAPRAATLNLTTPGLLELIGVEPVSGRLPARPARAKHEPIEALIGQQFAHDLGGREPLAAGDTVIVDSTTVVVVGIAEPNFIGPIGQPSRRPIWIVDPSLGDTGGAQCESALGEMRDGVTADSAQRLVSASAGAGPTDGTAAITALAGIMAHPPGGSLTSFYLRYGMTVTGAVLLLLCVNVSVLYACTLVARRREVAIRLALGATDLQIGRQLLAEWLATMAIASGLGVLLYLIIASRIDAATPGLALEVSLTTCLGVAALTLLVSVLTYLMPARAAARMSPNQLFRDGTSRARFQRSLHDKLLVALVALAAPVLIAVYIVAWQGLAGNPEDGLDPAHRSRLMQMSINWSRAGSEWRETARQVDSAFSVLTRAGTISGATPLAGNRRQARVAGDQGTEMVELQSQNPGRLALEGRLLLHGRDMLWTDSVGGRSPVIISDQLAMRLFNTKDVVGRTIAEEGRGSGGQMSHQIVGVLPERAFTGLGSQPSVLYLENRGRQGWADWLIQSSSDAEASLALVQEAFTRAFPELGISVSTLEEARQRRVESSLWIGAFTWGLAILCSGLALTGIFAVTGLSVRIRWKEIAIRNALGANGWQLLLVFMHRAVSTTARGLVYAGLLVGLVLLLVTTQASVWIAAAWAWLFAGVVLLLLTVVASGIAASRVIFVHPAQVLHHD